jgi:predicted dehydrogenase
MNQLFSYVASQIKIFIAINAETLPNQDKGQKAEVASFIRSVLQGGSPPIPFDEIYSTSVVTFKALESARSGQSVPV